MPLQKLDALRGVLVQTDPDNEEHGAPLGLRWFLYSGSDLYPAARRIYYARFLNQLLFAQVQETLLASLQRLAIPPSPDDKLRHNLRQPEGVPHHHIGVEAQFLLALSGAGKPVARRDAR